jgi:signal transduction histidine kinase
MSQYLFHWALSLGMTAATSLALGLFVLLYTNGRPLGRLFALWCLTVMWWSGGELLMITRSTGVDTVFWGRALQAGDIVLPTLFLHFVGMLVERPLRRGALITLYATASVFALLIILTPWVITHGFKTHSISAYFEIPGPLYLPMLTFFLAQCVIAIFLLSRAYREAQGQARLRYGYYLTGTAIGYVGGCTNFLPVYGLDSLPALYVYGSYGVPIYVGITAYAIVRHRLFDIRVVLPKSLATGLLIGSVSLVAFVAILVTDRATLTLAPLLIVGLLVFLIGARMLVQYPKSATHTRMSILCSLVAMWLFTIFMMQTSHEVKIALWWHHLAWIAIAFIPSCAYHFATAVGVPRKRDRFLLVCLYACSGAIATNWSLCFSNELYSYPSGLAPKAASLFPLYLSYLFAAGILTLRRLYQEYGRRLDSQDRETSRAHAMFWGVAFGGLGALDILQYYVVHTSPLGLLGVILWICLVSPALSPKPLEHSVLSRLLASHHLWQQIATVLVCYGLMLGAIRVVTDTWYFVTTAVLVALTALFASVMLGVRHILERSVTNHLFRQQDLRHQAIMSYTKDMLTTLHLKTLKTNILQSIATVMRTSHVSLFLFNTDKTEYILAANLGNGDGIPQIDVSPRSVFAEYIRQSESIIITDTLAHAPAGKTDQDLKIILNVLSELHTELCCPINTNTELIGFLILGPKENSKGYSHDDLMLLSSLVQTAAIALVNAQYYEDLRQSELLAAQSKHLRSLTTMAGGFAHEIRNPLTSIKTFLQLMGKEGEDSELMDRFMRTVNGDVARIERLIKEILNCTTYMNPILGDESINAIVKSCLNYVQIKAKEQDIKVQVDLADDLPRVWVDGQQITQILVNILLNAVEAMTPGPGRLLIQTHRLLKGTDTWIEIQVTDTGCGIKAEDLDHIFDPFFTTKHNRREWEGTGLGLTIVDQIVRQHGGYIEVSSRIEQGTTFVINIPADARKVGSPSPCPVPPGERAEKALRSFDKAAEQFTIVEHS